MNSTRVSLILFALVLALGIAAYAGPRSGLLVLIGLGFGLTMEGLGLGFSGPWRLLVTERDGRGCMAQLVAIGLTALLAIPLLAVGASELIGAHAPVGIGMVLGAFVFGLCMQLVLGCGSGTLLNAGSGNLVSAVALVTFMLGSFFGTLNLGWWARLGSLPVLTLQGLFGTVGGLLLTLLLLLGVGLLVWQRAVPGKRRPSDRLLIAAGLVAGFAILNLLIAGQPWGIVYGLGLWGAKLFQVLGLDVAATAFWSAPANAERLAQSVLLDVTSLTNIGLVIGAFIVLRWRAAVAPQVAALQPVSWLVVAAAGLVLGYSSRIAFGCNVGGFFSGISTGSLHGWAWLLAGFAGSTIGIRLRERVLVPLRPPVAAAEAA
ncbi:MAG: YeeE/YedE family protein [Chromatiaceae bacterium]|nr:MAG: YeeE/YedE family protein [Chromatiaceae bacterium]